jgi:4-hydroxybenzoate polyprenyltransferase
MDAYLPVKRILQFFVYSNLFIAGCAVLMVDQTYHLLIQQRPDLNLLAFVFFSTICSYSFHWYLTPGSLVKSPRIEWVNKYRIFHLVLFLIGILGAGFFFFRLWSHWYWLALSAVITFLYSAPKVPLPLFRALRKVAVGKTVFLAAVWTYVTAVLPPILSGTAWSTTIVLYVVSRFFFIYGICILFDFRDRADDKAAGIRSMVTYFSEKGVDILFFLSMLIFEITTLCLHSYGISWLNIFLLLIPGIIAQGIYQYAKRHFSDYLYYFFLDGLMMFSALLMLVFRI